MSRDERLELGDELDVAPEREVGLDPPFEHSETGKIEPQASIRASVVRFDPGRQTRASHKVRAAPV